MSSPLIREVREHLEILNDTVLKAETVCHLYETGRTGQLKAAIYNLRLSIDEIKRRSVIQTDAGVKK